MNEYLTPLQRAQIKATRPDARIVLLNTTQVILRAYYDQVARKKRIARLTAREDYLADLEIARRTGK